MTSPPNKFFQSEIWQSSLVLSSSLLTSFKYTPLTNYVISTPKYIPNPLPSIFGVINLVQAIIISSQDLHKRLLATLSTSILTHAIHRTARLILCINHITLMFKISQYVPSILRFRPELLTLQRNTALSEFYTWSRTPWCPLCSSHTSLLCLSNPSLLKNSHLWRSLSLKTSSPYHFFSIKVPHYQRGSITILSGHLILIHILGFHAILKVHLLFNMSQPE